MKKINIFMSRLKYGGMELSLINFINKALIKTNYEINLYLMYCVNNELLEKLDKKVKIHLLCKKKWNLTNKIIGGLQLIMLYLYPKKSDIGICYSNHQKTLSLLTRHSSKKSIIFVHSDMHRYETEEDIKRVKKIGFDKFDTIICVSDIVKKSLIDIYGKKISKKCEVVHNYVDGDRIKTLSKEKTKEKINYLIPTFINIANHVEKYKNIDLIINTAKKLVDLNKEFQVLLIGTGEDTPHYKELISKYNLENYIKILGSKSNPYPYLKNSKALVFTSRYEGYGMVLDEARVLGIPIITTGSGASIEICNEGYGIVTDNLEESMLQFINKKFETKNFNYENHNKNITKKIHIILEKIGENK